MDHGEKLASIEEANSINISSGTKCGTATKRSQKAIMQSVVTDDNWHHKDCAIIDVIF